MADTFVCEHCGGEFEKGRPDAEAATESRALWGVDLEVDPTMATLCEDCFQAFMAWWARQSKAES